MTAELSIPRQRKPRRKYNREQKQRRRAALKASSTPQDMADKRTLPIPPS